MTPDTILERMLARDLADDLHRDKTFFGGYRPTERVMLQRQWSERLGEELHAAAQAATSHKIWTEYALATTWLGLVDLTGWRREDELRSIARHLAPRGLLICFARIDGELVQLQISLSTAEEIATGHAARQYLARLEAEHEKKNAAR